MMMSAELQAVARIPGEHVIGAADQMGCFQFAAAAALFFKRAAARQSHDHAMPQAVRFAHARIAPFQTWHTIHPEMRQTRTCR